MNNALILHALILCHVSSGDAGPVRLCDKPDFPEAYYDGPVIASPQDTVLTLTCKDSYKPGFPRTTCNDGQWTNPTPACQLVECQQHDLVAPHVLINTDCFGVKCMATLNCAEGYWYYGPNTRTCQRNGNWSGQSPICDAIECPLLPNPLHGTVLQENRSYLATAEVKCNTGYRFSEPLFSTRMCLANATWSWGNGSCQAEPCPPLEAVDNGVLSATSGNFKDEVTLECHDGFTLDGTRRISCIAGGKWSKNIGICKNGKSLLGVWIALAILIVCIPVVVAVFYRFKSAKCPGTTMTTPQDNVINIPLLDKGTELYLHLNLTQSFGGEYGDESSSQYAVVKSLIEEKILNAMKNTQVKKIDVLRLDKPDKILLCIISQEPIEPENVCNALEQVNIPCTQSDQEPYRIVPNSLIFDDKVTNHIKLQILRGKHSRDHGMDFEIDLDSEYEEVRIIRQSRPHSPHKDAGEDISDVDVIKDGAQERLILILGLAGVGKSTLMQRLARKWANGVWATHLKAIFLLNLRYLMSDKTEMSLGSLLCLRPIYVNKDNMLSIDDVWIVENQEAIAIMLDGLDEISKIQKFLKSYDNTTGDNTPLDWCFLLLRRKCLPKSTLLVSSRSSETISSFLEPTDTVEVMGLSSTMITSFVKKNVKEKQRERVKQALKGNSMLMSLSPITFWCAALCGLLQEDDTPAAKPNTYTRITAHLLQMYICRSLKDDHTWKDVIDELGTSLRRMSQLAYKGLTESGNFKERYTEEDLEAAGITNSSVVKLQNAGLLLRSDIPDPEDPHKYSVYSQFVHSSAQEYMAMAHLLSKNSDERKRTLDNLLSPSHQSHNALLYLVGLAFNEEVNAISRTADAMANLSKWDLGVCHEIKDALTDAAMTVPDPVLAIQMVYESQSMDVASQVGASRFRDGLTLRNVKMTLFDVKGLTYLLRNCLSISRIDLTEVGLDLSSVQEISKLLIESKTIKETSLLDSSLEGKAIKELMGAVKENKHLEKLELSVRQDCGDDIMTCVADTLSENTTLKDLWLVGGTLRTGGAVELLQALHTGNQQVHIRMYNHTCDESTWKTLQPLIQRGLISFEEKGEGKEPPPP